VKAFSFTSRTPGCSYSKCLANFIKGGDIRPKKKLKNTDKFPSETKERRKRWKKLNQVGISEKPIECLEYVIAHEMVHLLGRKHDERFTSYMEEYLPMWRSYKDELNRRPLNHQDWKY
jgi:hypothetical protein